MIATLQALDEQSTTQVRKQIDEELKTVSEEDSPELISAWDDVSGAELEPENVYEARMEEVRLRHRFNGIEHCAFGETTTGFAAFSCSPCRSLVRSLS